IVDRGDVESNRAVGWAGAERVAHAGSDAGVEVVVRGRQESDRGQGGVDSRHPATDGPDAGGRVVGSGSAHGQGASGRVGQGQGGGDGVAAVRVGDDNVVQGDAGGALGVGLGLRQVGRRRRNILVV